MVCEGEGLGFGVDGGDVSVVVGLGAGVDDDLLVGCGFWAVLDDCVADGVLLLGFVPGADGDWLAA